MPKPTLDLPSISEKDQQRFWGRVNKTDLSGCWLWTSTKNREGYGLFTYGGQTYRAHRISWALTFGRIPKGLLVLHRCDNPSCVRAHEHLFLGTCTDNNRDCMKKGRTAHGDRHYSKTHPEKVARGDRHSSRTRIECRPRGENNWRAKLTESDVRTIRELAASGMFQTHIAARFGVTQGTIWNIIRRRTWRHVP